MEAWFTLVLSATGMVAVVLFAFQHGVFGEKCCCTKKNGSNHEHRLRFGIGLGVSTRPERVDSSQVPTSRAESEEEGTDGSFEAKSGRSGGLSSDERSEEDEDWGGTV